jgi:hypothetical protein
MKRIPFVAMLAAIAQSASFALPTTAAAQVAYDSPKGRVEVLGLRRWTLAMLQDSIRRYVPGQELHDAACVVTLRDSLHFAEASVDQFEMDAPGQPRRSFLSIKVVEPEQAMRIQWDSRARNEFSSLLPDYAPLVLSVTDSTGAVWRGRLLYWLQFSDSDARVRAIAGKSEGRRADADLVFAFLARHHGEADRTRAMRVMALDGFWVNRMAAVAVLSNFAAHDSTWWVLVRALRDPHEAVREAAVNVLRTLPARPIDWHGSVSDLRLLLGGTNLFAMQGVFDMLARTAIAPELARGLLRDNAEWVLDYLASETPMASPSARRLLVRLNAGSDLGPSRLAWAEWARAL